MIQEVKDAGLERIDKRSNSGSLWVIGDQTLNGFMTKMQKKGASFKCRAGGGKATKGKDAWWVQAFNREM